MTTTTATATTARRGPRIAVPKGNVCASCGRSRDNKRKDWEPVLDGQGNRIGWTCDQCPRADEPIRWIKTKTGVRFRAVVDATPPGARERRQSTKTCMTLAEARAHVEQVRATVKTAGTYERETIADLAKTWLANRVDVREVTRAGYAAVLVTVLRRIGDIPVADLTPANVRDMVTWLSTEGGRGGRPLSPRTVRACLSVLSQILDQAVIDGKITRNVTFGVKAPTTYQDEEVGKDLEHWPIVKRNGQPVPETMLKFRDVADRDRLAACWRLTLNGMTRADVLGLKWSDVDFDAGTVEVARGRVQLPQGSAVGKPKRPQRWRTLPIERFHPGTLDLLRAERLRQRADTLAAGQPWSEDRFVCVDENGAPLRPERYSDRFRALCVEAGVPVIHLHSVRHSCALWFNSLGIPPTASAAWLGHTLPIFLATYSPGSGKVGIEEVAATVERTRAAVALL